MTTDFVPKQRSLPDCIPTDSAEWNAMPPAVEQAYRRGRCQGFLEAVRLAKEGAAIEDLERFGYGKLWQWRYQRRMRYSLPPAFRPPRRRRPTL